MTHFGYVNKNSKVPGQGSNYGKRYSPKNPYSIENRKTDIVLRDSNAGSIELTPTTIFVIAQKLAGKM